MSDKKKEVLEMFAKGESISKISKTLRINKSVVRGYLRESEEEKSGKAAVYTDAVSGEEVLQILDLYDFMAGAYLKEGLATGVLESKDFTEPFSKESRLSGKALVYLASRARGEGVSFKKLFEVLARLSPADGMREKIRGLEEERARLGEQASRVAEELCSAKKSLRESRDYIKVLEKRPGDKEKIRVLEEALERAKTALSDEQAKAMSLAASLQAIRQILDKGTPAKAAAPDPDPAETVKEASPAVPSATDKEETSELISIKEWGKMNDVPYSTATDAARAGRITGIVVKGSRYFCPADAEMVPTDSVCGRIRLKADLPDGYVSITGWAALHGMTGARAKRLVQENRIPGVVRIGSQTYAHRGINPLNPDGAVTVGGSMLPLKTVCRSQGVDYYAVRRKIAKAGVPDGAQKDGVNLLVPETTDLAAFLGRRRKEKTAAPEPPSKVPSTEGLVPFKALTVASGVPYMTAVHDLRRAGVEVTKIGRIAFVPEGTDLLELRKLYGRRPKEHPAEEIAAPAAEPSAEAVPAVPAEPVKEVQDKAGDDAVFNAAVATAAIKNVPVSDVCSTVFKVMIDEYGYRLGDAPTFDAVRAENGERDFMAVLKNFDRHYQRLNAG